MSKKNGTQGDGSPCTLAPVGEELSKERKRSGVVSAVHDPETEQKEKTRVFLDHHAIHDTPPFLLPCNAITKPTMVPSTNLAVRNTCDALYTRTIITVLHPLLVQHTR